MQDVINELRRLQELLRTEIDNFIVKDTFTRGKQTGLRKAINIISDEIAHLSKYVD